MRRLLLILLRWPFHTLLLAPRMQAYPNDRLCILFNVQKWDSASHYHSLRLPE
jgi:hypothetical protein